MKNDDRAVTSITELLDNYKNFEDGNAARDIDNLAYNKPEPVRIPREHEIRRYEPEPDQAANSNPRRRSDIVTALVLALAILVTCLACFNYLQTRADIVKLEKQISSIENSIAMDDMEIVALERLINSKSTDLDHIYNVAVGVLGMVYPNNNEIHFYQSEGGSYYRDFSAAY